MAPPVLLHCFPTFEVGGSQIRFCQLANQFGGQFRHLIVPMDGAISAAARLESHVPYELVPVEIPKNNTLHNVLMLRRVLKDLKPDRLITYNWGAIEWAMANLLVGLPHLHIEDGFGPEERSAQKPQRMMIRRLVLSWRSQVILPSRTLYESALTQWKLPKKRVFYVPNGIDCQRFTQAPDAALVASLRQRPDDVVVGIVAALRDVKNIPRLIDAIAQVTLPQTVRLVVVGEGVEKEAIEAHATARGIRDRVILTGAIKDPARILAGFDVFALSSDTEQMPYSILEAMATGLPIASVDVGDIKTMVSAANRPYVNGQDAASLAVSLGELLRQPALRHEIGQANQAQAVALYDQAQMFERYFDVFTGL